MELKCLTSVAATAAIALLSFSPALAQRQPPSPEQRLERLERQVQQVQRQVFPKGRPADTAGFADEPAATQSSIVTINQRLDSLERQMADILRQSEENGQRARILEGEIAQLRTAQEQRITAIERRLLEAPTSKSETAADSSSASPPAKPKPPAVEPAAKAPLAAPAAPVAEGDPGEDAYTEGFRLWEAGNHDAAIASLRAFTSAYPKHRRVSFANNLVGRALLDKGQPRAAAEALLANYRGDPKGERAPDSLYYLGEALIKLGQPAQACKAFAELDAVYGAKIRPDLKKLETDAKARAQCK